MDEKGMEPEEIIKMVATTGYTDVAGMLRARGLLGIAEDKLWKKAVKEIKSKYHKEMKDGINKLTKWGTIQPSEAGIKDIIAKVLISHNIYPYPELVQHLYKNPFELVTQKARPATQTNVGFSEGTEAHPHQGQPQSEPK